MADDAPQTSASSPRAQPLTAVGDRTGNTVGRQFILLLPAVMVADHLATWAVTAKLSGVPLATALAHLDSGWYGAIATQGYSGRAWAFFPLYPLLVRLLRLATFGALPTQVAGAVLSTLLLAGFAAWVAALASRAEYTDALLAPKTALGWFCFVYAPASFTLHTAHTEALFALLSLAAFYFSARGAWPLAGSFAGLCAATRIQGFLVIPAVLAGAVAAGGTARGRARNALAAAALALPIASCWLAYQQARTGSPFTFVGLQAAWSHPTSTPGIYLGAFLLANPWQNQNVGSILHHAFVGALAVALIPMRRRSLALWLYLILSLLIMPLEGEFVNAFRYGTVLFPALFVLGDWLDRQPLSLRAPVAACVVVLNHWVAVNYIINHWAY